MKAKTGRVIVLGLDGVTFDLLEPWAREGHLPAIRRVLEHGACGVLRSTHPPMSAQAWTTIVTGRNMARHGIVDFAARVPGTYRLEYLNGGRRVGPAIWDVVSAAGRRVSVVNVPMTYPPRPVSGVLVAGMDAPSVTTDFVYPSALRHQLLSRFPSYQIEARPFSKLHGATQDRAGMLQEVLQIEEIRFNAVRYLQESCSSTFSMAVFRSADIIQHWFWKHMDPLHPQHQPGDEEYGGAILQAYRQLDRFAGWYLARITNQDVLILLSDHGFGPVSDRVVQLNTWLQEQGWLAFRSGMVQSSYVRSLWRAWTLARRVLSPYVKERLLKWFPEARAKVPTAAAFSGIDWARTRAFALETRGVIYINLRGREPQGLVEPGEEYEHLRSEIVTRLEQWRDPLSGERLVEGVYRREELFDGPLLEWVPDLIVDWAHRCQPNLGYRAVSGRSQAVQILSPSELQRFLRPNASHQVDGVLMMYGGPIWRGRLGPQELVDVAPTILYLAGLSIPKDMDGRVVTEAIQPGFLRANPVRLTDAAPSDFPVVEAEIFSEADREKIAERLRGLGYID